MPHGIRAIPGGLGQSPQQSRRDRTLFPEYYEEYQRTLLDPAAPVVCIGPISYRGQALVSMDIAHLKAALQGLQVEEAFLPAIAPSSFARFQNQDYPTEEAFLLAIAEAMHEEYKAIVEAGFILQIDDPGLPDTWDMLNPAPRVITASSVRSRRIAIPRRACWPKPITNKPSPWPRHSPCARSWPIAISASAGSLSREAGENNPASSCPRLSTCTAPWR
jgi:hypothetical protein